MCLYPVTGFQGISHCLHHKDGNSCISVWMKSPEQEVSVSQCAARNVSALQSGHFLHVCTIVHECAGLAVSVKCDLGMSPKACWAVKRRCGYNFSIPLFSPQLHWYLVPATPISLGALGHKSSLQGYRLQHTESIYIHVDPIKARTMTAFPTQTRNTSGSVMFVSSHPFFSTLMCVFAIIIISDRCRIFAILWLFQQYGAFFWLQVIGRGESFGIHVQFFSKFNNGTH